MRTLKNHEENVIDVCFMPRLPLFCSVSEDGKLNFYSMKNFEFAFDMSNFMNKGWSLSSRDNLVAVAYDEGCVVVQLGNDKPLSSSVNGKLMWTSNSQVFSSNLKALITKNTKNFENLEIKTKELGNLEIFPKSIEYNTNG